jgi:tetratricopeptide (TPR) repeat protein
MIGKRFVAVVVLGSALALGAAGSLSVRDSAFAAGQTVSAKVGKPLQDAQKLIEQKKYREALTQVNEADKISPKTTYEQFIVNDMQGFLYQQLGDYGNAAKAYEATIKSGQLPAKDVATRQRALVSMYYVSKNYSKALSSANQVLASGGPDADMYTIAGQSSFILGDYAGAAKSVAAAIQLGESAGRRPDETSLQLLMSSQYKSGDTKGYAKTLERLVRTYPKPEYWNSLLASELNKPGTSDKRSLDIYRLQLAVGGLVKPDDYMSMAKVALVASFPGDAKAALERGFKAGVLGKGAAEQADKQKRLLAAATKQAADDQAILPQLESQANASAQGDLDVRLGELYASYGQYDKAIGAIQRGLAKGGVKNVGEAKLSLAWAYVLANQKDKARQTFSSIDGKDGTSDLARLWLIHLS